MKQNPISVCLRRKRTENQKEKPGEDCKVTGEKTKNKLSSRRIYFALSSPMPLVFSVTKQQVHVYIYIYICDASQTQPKFKTTKTKSEKRKGNTQRDDEGEIYLYYQINGFVFYLLETDSLIAAHGGSSAEDRESYREDDEKERLAATSFR